MENGLVVLLGFAVAILVAHTGRWALSLTHNKEAARRLGEAACGTAFIGLGVWLLAGLDGQAYGRGGTRFFGSSVGLLVLAAGGYCLWCAIRGKEDANSTLGIVFWFRSM